MASTAQLIAMRQWLQDNGGYFHAHASIEHNLVSGVHCRAQTLLPTNTTICTVPHSLAISSLNALVDDTFTVFRNRGLAVEAIGHFYLMRQYIEGSKSFWNPYLKTLPGPDAEHGTPFYFDEDDLPWLEDTDVLHTTKARRETQQSHYNQGIAMLKAANVDAGPYTWKLFMWAVTIFTSRSFSSVSLRPHDSKYWTAYKTGQQGRRQTVLLDMSRASAEELDFPVLFPVIDILNHAHSAKVHWAYDPGRFSLTILDETPMGSEIFNNYGPKRNDELLLGYGFCLADNPHDKALLTLKAPPPELHEDIRRVQPGYFDSAGTWSSEKATFALAHAPPQTQQNPEAIFHELPEPLLELLLYILRNERGLPFDFMANPLIYLTAAGSIGRQYLPHIARMILQSLLPKLATLQASTPQQIPQNQKQEQARIYRDGQMRILQSITDLRFYLKALTYSTNHNGPMIVTLEDLLEVLRLRASGTHASAFLAGIGSCAGTTDIDQLRDAGWEDDAFVLLICWVYALCPSGIAISECLVPRQDIQENDDIEQAKSAFDLVQAAAQAVPDSFWSDGRWSEAFIADVGGRLLKFESFAMMVPREGEGGHDGESGDVRLVFYLHG